MKVKWLLDGCGNYLLEGNTAESGVLSRYKEMKIGNNEIPWSSCSEAILERTEVDDKKHAGQPRGGDELSYITSDKEHPEPSAHESKFQRMKTLFQNGSLSSCRVDTDGVFVHNGDRYQINGSVEVYQPKQTKIGLLYDADTIYCFTPKGSKTVYFYAQNLDFLSESVTKLTKNGGMDIGSAR
jgi:hypothetical protein